VNKRNLMETQFAGAAGCRLHLTRIMNNQD